MLILVKCPGLCANNWVLVVCFHTFYGSVLFMNVQKRIRAGVNYHPNSSHIKLETVPDECYLRNNSK